jgi:ATP-dependent RNA helicase DeaD
MRTKQPAQQRVDRRKQQEPFEGPERRRVKQPPRARADAHAHDRDRDRDRERPNGERRPREQMSAVWFTINVGRSKNADPKWLIPLLCRRGNVTKRAIGKIQVLARETRVEISSDAAEQFAEAVRRPDPKDPRIHIERVDEAL